MVSIRHSARLKRIGAELAFLADYFLPRSDLARWRAMLEIRADGGLYSKSIVKRFTRQFPQPKLRRGAAREAPSIESGFLRFCIENYPHARGQLCQDLLALYLTREKRNGYFVEFGATDGLNLSNTYLLESAYGWKGILVEPAPVWHRDLRMNRKAIIDGRCVWSASGQTLRFDQTSYPELSTVAGFTGADLHATSRVATLSFDVKTVSLTDLLQEHSAPAHIDYLSIDTEGTELEILAALDFRKHFIALITVEHNYEPVKQAGLHSLLTTSGFVRVMEEFSLFDGWYVHGDILHQLRAP